MSFKIFFNDAESNEITVFKGGGGGEAFFFSSCIDGNCDDFNGSNHITTATIIPIIPVIIVHISRCGCVATKCQRDYVLVKFLKGLINKKPVRSSIIICYLSIMDLGDSIEENVFFNLSEEEIKHRYKDVRIPSSSEEAVRWLLESLQGTIEEMTSKNLKNFGELRQSSFPNK